MGRVSKAAALERAILSGMVSVSGRTFITIESRKDVGHVVGPLGLTEYDRMNRTELRNKVDELSKNNQHVLSRFGNMQELLAKARVKAEKQANDYSRLRQVCFILTLGCVSLLLVLWREGII